MGSARRSGTAAALAPGVPRGEPIPISTGAAQLHDDGDGTITVYINGVPSSTLRDDFELDFEYMRHEAAAIAAWDDARADHSWLALHVGAAACTLPRHLVHAHPNSRHIAVDVDVTLAELARRWWDLPRAPRLRVRAQDGLEALAERADASLDLIVRDAFLGDQVPDHLRSAAWWEHARRVLRPGGLVVANSAVTPASGGADDGDALAAADVFGDVLAVGEHAVLKRKRRGNAVLVVGTMPLAALTHALQRYAASAPLPTAVTPDWR